MLKKVLLGVGVAFVVLLVVIQLQPAELRVERSSAIAAEPAVVFPLTMTSTLGPAGLPGRSSTQT